jgi:hypothetical protein
MAPGANMCIVAFAMFAGASIATFYLKERKHEVGTDEQAQEEIERIGPASKHCRNDY